MAHRRARPGLGADARPDGEATLYIRPRSPRDTDEFFRDAVYGELWIGRRHTLAEKAAELGIRTRQPGRPRRGAGRLRPGPHPRAARRTTRGSTPRCYAYEPAEAGARDGELATTLSELRLVKDEWEVAQLQDAIDATVRGFEDVARVLPADRTVAERLLEGVFGLRARHDGNDAGVLLDRRGRRRTRPPCTGSATPAPPRRASCC